GFVVEACANGFPRHHDNGFPDTLVVQLVERDEHQRAAFPRGRGRFNKEVLLTALFIGALLHHAHTHFVRFRGATVRRVVYRYGGDRLFLAHFATFFLRSTGTVCLGVIFV